MGQYYRPIILKRNYKKLVNPIEISFNSWDYDNGLKLMEHSYIGNSFVRAVEEMLSSDYKGYPFVWCGDYSDNVKYKRFKGNLYDYASLNGEKFDKVVTKSVPYRKYIINYTKREYIQLNDRNGKLQIHPLPIICSNSNGRGGGDYYGTNMKYVGYWAYDRIGVSNDVPDGFKELKIHFDEDY